MYYYTYVYEESFECEDKFYILKKDTFDYNCATNIKNLNKILDSVLLVEDEILTNIIVFVDIPIEECAHIEEISRGIYDCGGSVHGALWKNLER